MSRFQTRGERSSTASSDAEDVSRSKAGSMWRTERVARCTFCGAWVMSCRGTVCPTCGVMGR